MLDQFENCVPIHNLFSNSETFNDFEKIPTLDIGDRRGWTDYIDFIRAEEMPCPIMKGIDTFRRPFLAIKVTAKYIGSDTELIGKKFDLVGTIFQRYSDQSFSWAYGTCYDSNMLLWDSRLRDYEYKEIEDRLKRIFNKETVKNIQFYKLDQTITSNDYIIGNGDWEISLAQ